MRVSRSKREPLRILGVDPSLTSTGYAYRDLEGKVKTGRIVPGDLQGPWRLSYIRKRMEAILLACEPKLIVYEGYAMGFGSKRNPGRVFDIGELGGVLKLLFWERGIDVVLVSPSTLKMTVAGKGTLSKGIKGKRELQAAIKRRFDLDVSQSDEADAAGLMIVGELLTGSPTIPQNVRQSLRLAGLAKCETTKGRLQSIAKK